MLRQRTAASLVKTTRTQHKVPNGPRPSIALSPSRTFSACSSQQIAPTATLADLEAAYASYNAAPPSQKLEYSADLLGAYNECHAAGLLPKWGAAAGDLERRSVQQGELRMVGIKDPSVLATPSTRNDAAFLVTVVGVTSVMAVVLGQLPGDWGFFGAYLSGGISIAVLAVGSTAPGLLAFAIDRFSQVFPDYRARVVAHEAAHFLVGYLMGLPITRYDVQLGSAHVEFAEAKIQQRIIERQLEDAEVNAMAVMAVAGIAAEGQMHAEVMGQTADLLDLQRILNRSRTKMTSAQQQNTTRWAAYTAAALLRRYKAEFDALQGALAEGKPVMECVRLIEGTPTAA